VSDAEQRLRAFFEANCGHATAVYLFGSVARGEATPASDVDVAVLFDRAPEPTLSGIQLTLQGELERYLERNVDLVVLNGAPADLVHRVLRDGVIVLDRDRSARIKFEVAKRNEFFDLEPLRRRYRRGAGSNRPTA